RSAASAPGPAASTTGRTAHCHPGQEESLRQELVACWQRHFGTDRAPVIGELLMQLRSPLDWLDSAAIPPEKQVSQMSGVLVSVVSAQSSSSRIEGVAFRPDSGMLAVTDSKSVQLWKVGGAQPEKGPTLGGHSKEVVAVAFSPDGKMLAAGSK